MQLTNANFSNPSVFGVEQFREFLEDFSPSDLFDNYDLLNATESNDIGENYDIFWAHPLEFTVNNNVIVVSVMVEDYYRNKHGDKSLDEFPLDVFFIVPWTADGKIDSQKMLYLTSEEVLLEKDTFTVEDVELTFNDC